jgi:hypothetical protein
MSIMLSQQRINLTEKVMILWTVFLLGTLFHPQLALMSFSHGLSVAPAVIDSYAAMTKVLWSMLTFFMLPMWVMIAAVFMPSRRFRAVHFGLTLLYSGVNAFYLGLDVLVRAPLHELGLMLFLVGIGGLLNVVAYRWWRSTETLRLWLSVSHPAV